MFGEACNGAVCKMLVGDACLERDGDAGERGDSVEEPGIEMNTEAGERMQRGRIVGVVDGQHACGGGGSVGQRCIAFKDRDLRAAAVKFERKR